MGKLSHTTEEIDTLLNKVKSMPENISDGKTPIFETGTTSTLTAGSQATSEIVRNGEDQQGNPKYKINFGIPKGKDGSGGSSTGGGDGKIVNIDEMLNELNSGTITQNNLDKLKTYQAGDYIVKIGGALVSLTLSEPKLIISGVAPQALYGIFIAIYDIDINTRHVEQYSSSSPVSELVGELGILSGYKKDASYSAITENDTINKAIGKLEAGLSSVGGDSVHLLSSDIFNLKKESTSDEISKAFGGKEGVVALIEAAKAKKDIRIGIVDNSIGLNYYSVDVFVLLHLESQTTFILSFDNLNQRTHYEMKVTRNGDSSFNLQELSKTNIGYYLVNEKFLGMDDSMTESDVEKIMAPLVPYMEKNVELKFIVGDSKDHQCVNINYFYTTDDTGYTVHFIFMLFYGPTRTTVTYNKNGGSKKYTVTQQVLIIQ